MRRYFHSLADVLESPIAQAARAASHTQAQLDRVLKSTRLEDMLYTQLRRGDTELDTLEEDCKDRLSTFPRHWIRWNVWSTGTGTAWSGCGRHWTGWSRQELPPTPVVCRKPWQLPTRPKACTGRWRRSGP